MIKIFTKSLFFTTLFIAFVFEVATAQTITIGNVDPGPYGQGSTIGVPINVNTSSGCILKNSTYNLYLSDAAGNFTNKVLIGTLTDFYATFVNGLIPPTTPTGNGYKVMVVSTKPVVSSSASAAFTISAVNGVVAGVTSSYINPAYPEVFGSCNGKNNTSYAFVDQSTAGSAVTASFFNETTKSLEGAVILAPSANFNAKNSNYTVNIKALNGGIVGTKAFTLINNPVFNSFGASGSTTTCLGTGTGLSYNVDITSSNGIQNNYPGTLYYISWGDNKMDTLTLCNIVSSGGTISHVYTKTSCGQSPNGQANSFEVDLQPGNIYCGFTGTKVTSYAKVASSPINDFTGPVAGCANTSIGFINKSFPGDDPNNTTANCVNAPANYSWLVDGNTIQVNYTYNQSFNYTFTSPGQHSVTLHLQSNGTMCTDTDITRTICIQNPPQPIFTMPSLGGCAPATITPVNQSIIDANCNAGNTYQWIVNGSAPVSYANGTNDKSFQPKFVFTAPGLYDVSLAITTATCGTVTSPVQTISIDAGTVANLSPDATFCGSNQTLSFSPTGGATQTTITGTTQPQPGTYTWTVTGGAYSFAPGSAFNDQYPQITFTDYTTYHVSVTVQNSCGTVTKSQNLTFQYVPPVTITPSSATICPGSIVSLTATINGSYKSFQWIGSGTFSAPGSLNTNYTPTAAEVNAGNAVITLDVKTNLVGQCSDIQQTLTENIFPVNNITSASAAEVCTATPVNYNITSTVPGSTFTWTAVLTSGTATGFTNGNGGTINDVITNKGSSNAIVTYTITPYANGCTGNPFSLTVTVDEQSSVTAAAANNSICSGSPAGITLTPNIPGTTYTWTSQVLSGNITGNTHQTTAINTAAINDILSDNDNNGTSGSIRYTITPYNGICPGTPVNVTVMVLPTVFSNAGNNDEVCNAATYTLNGNNPSPETGKWTVSPAGSVIFNDATKYNTTARGLIPGNIYTFTWTISPAAPCASNSSSVIITDDAPSVGGTTTGNATVCAGSNSGTITLSGQFGNIIRWESSVDNGSSWQPIANTINSQQYLNLISTTMYRAVVQNGLCSIQFSTAANIIVNQPPIQANAGGNQSICGANTVTLQGNDPSPFAGVWTQTSGPAATIVSPNNPKTQVTGLIPGNDFTFIWTIKGQAPCSDSIDSAKIHDPNDVIPSFTNDNPNSCGGYTVNFTNMSTAIAGASFLWDFGDDSPTSTAVNPSHTFIPRNDGRDTTYTISLSVVGNCMLRPPFTLSITVSPQTPTAYITPQQITGCSPFTLAVDNYSPGNNKSYTYYLYDNTTLVQQITKTDKSEVRFDPLNTNVSKQYSLYMVATNFCGVTGQSNIIPINVSATTIVAQMFLENGINKGCIPFVSNFVNNSTGGDNYYYTIYDVNHAVVDRRQGGTAPLPYTFNSPGTYYVTITASNSCATVESSPPVRIDVYPLPMPQFTADVTTGCKNVVVSFTNQTPDDASTQAASLLYDWDFGDNSPHVFTFTPPPHTYNYKNSPYTVTLAATNNVTGCINIISKTKYIIINPPPFTEFTEKPDSITSLPNYRFNFIDQTIGDPIAWNWTFGDGHSATTQNPGHTYPDTGTYKVILTTTSGAGCDSTISHHVRINGVPGQLFLPNAFEPGSGTIELRTFAAKGSGIKQWHMQIFNNFSQLIWETTKLDAKGAPVDGWDGTFNGSPAPQGVYIWQVSASFINGTEWRGNVINNSLPKRTGVVHLIR